jgi:hypothetical protein
MELGSRLSLIAARHLSPGAMRRLDESLGPLFNKAARSVWDAIEEHGGAFRAGPYFARVDHESEGRYPHFTIDKRRRPRTGRGGGGAGCRGEGR